MGSHKKSYWQRLKIDLIRYKYLYLFFALPVVVYYIIFKYVPLYGLQIAFKEYRISRTMWECPWVGFAHFEEFFSSIYFVRTLRNTIVISLLDLAFGFPAPILFALLLNEVRNEKFKKVVQTVTYLPHFVSTVVICGLLVTFSAKEGLFNTIIEFFGGERTDLLMSKEAFRPIYIASGVWSGFGWGSIIYLSALASVDQEQYEAAYIDGAGRFQRMFHITLPGIMPTIVIKLIMDVGGLMGVGSEKILLLYNPLTYEVADVISTYVYRKGLVENDYSFSTAVGLFNSVINILLIVIANAVSRRLTDTSLW